MVTCRKVRQGDAYRSEDASMRVRSMPAMRVRTSTYTMAEVNIAWAAMTGHAQPQLRRAPRRSASRVDESNAVTAKMSVEMPMTMPGTMIAT